MEIAKRTSIICAVVVAFILSLFVIYISRTVIMYVFVSIILAISINPLVNRIEKYNIKRVLASSLAMSLLALILMTIVGVISRPLILEGISLTQNLPQITERITSNPVIGEFISEYNLRDSLNQISSYISTILLGSGKSILFIATNILSILSTGAIILVLTFLFLLEGERLWESLLKFLKPDDKETARRVAIKIANAVSGYITGNLIISLIAGSITLITLLLLQVPYAFALSALVALFDLIPMVGAAIATVILGFVSLTQGLFVSLIVVAVLLAYQFVEGNIIQPIIYSKSINLSPLFIVLASILGAEMFGIIGVILAIPVGAVLQIIVKEIYLYFHSVRNSQNQI